MYLIAWLMAFLLFFVFFYYYSNSSPPAYTLRGGALTIPADNLGHFRIKGSINGQNVTFIIDTGATWVAVPQSLAKDLQLKELYPVNMRTAVGEASGSLTRLQQIVFGNYTLENIKAVIVPGAEDDEVLLGMNVLSNFVLLQENDQLIIKAKKP